MLLERLVCCCLYDSKRACYLASLYSLIYFGSNCIIDSFMMSQVHFNEESSVLLLYGFLSLICSSISLITSLLLVIGLGLGSKRLIKPWIIAATISVVIDVLFIVVNPSMFSNQDLDLPAVGTLILDMLLWALMIYSVVCVIAHYLNLIAIEPNNVRSNHELHDQALHHNLSTSQLNFAASHNKRTTTNNNNYNEILLDDRSPQQGSSREKSNYAVLLSMF